MRDDDGDYVHNGSASLWHAWQDRPGIRHVPSYHYEQAIFSGYSSAPLFRVQTLEQIIQAVAGNGLFVLCSDVLNEHEFPYAHSMIGDKNATAYLSRAGNIPALRISYKRRSGFLVPSATWKWRQLPNRELVRGLVKLFTTFGYESTTPSSLSEKVLRATLPTPLGITRPSVWLRRDILDNHVGGRIDLAVPRWYKKVWEFDKIKAYPDKSRCVPSPFSGPVIRIKPRIDELMAYPTGWWSVRLIAHSRVIAPIQVDGRNPIEGEVIDKWLWTGEIQDCLEAGYTLIEIKRGYGFREMSDFMCRWVDLLWDKYQQTSDEWTREVIKAMMVGLPGRFLRQPETYYLIPIEEAKSGDIPLMMHWKDSDDRKFSDYVIRAEYDKESTALSYIGSYIVAEMRRELYHRMKEEVAHGFAIVRSYIDCYSVADSQSYKRRDYVSRNDRYVPGNDQDYRNIGSDIGQWKERTYTDVWAEENRFIGRGEDGFREMKAPGLEEGGDVRLAFWQKYYQIVQSYPQP
jgi:hypothetical protein